MCSAGTCLSASHRGFGDFRTRAVENPFCAQDLLAVCAGSAALRQSPHGNFASNVAEDVSENRSTWATVLLDF